MDKSDRSFIAAGIIVFIGLMCLLVIQFVQFNQAFSEGELEAKERVRSQYPAFQWVFDEWDKCNHGGGAYKGYYLKRRCNSALVEMGKNRQKDPSEIERIIELQDAEISDVTERIEPAWPLSAVGNLLLILLSA